MSPRDTILRRNNVHVLGQPEGPTLVFAHGFGCDQHMWREIVPAFEASHRIVLFDYVGAGRSDMTAFQPARYATLDGYAQDVLDIFEALELQQAVFVGHSVSSMIGLLAAIREPSRFARMVLVAPSPRYLNEPPYVGGFEPADLEGLLSLMDHNYLGWGATLAPVVMGNPDRPRLTRELEESFCSTDPLAAKAFARATFFADNRADLPKSPVPSLIVQVRDDALAPLSVGEYLRAHLPQSRLVVLEASGHCPHMSHPELTIEAMRDFVEDVDVPA